MSYFYLDLIQITYLCVCQMIVIFFKALKDFAVCNRLKMVSTIDFMNHIKKYYPKNLDSFFKTFLYQKDAPILDYKFKKMAKT